MLLLCKEQSGPTVGGSPGLYASAPEPGYPAGLRRGALGGWRGARGQTAREAAPVGGVVRRAARIEARLEELGRGTTAVAAATEDAAVLAASRSWWRVLGLGFVEVMVLVVAQTTVDYLAVDTLAYVAVQAQTMLLEFYLGIPELITRGYLLQVTLRAAASLVRRRTRRTEPLTITAQFLPASENF